jgi:hypothetical protein
LITDVPLYGPQIDEAGVLYSFAVFSVIGGHQVNVNIGPVGGSEIREAKHESAIAHAVNSCCPLRRMGNPIENSRLDRLYCTDVRGWQCFMNAFIDKEALGPKRIPRDEQNSTDRSNRYLPFIHFLLPP